MPSVRPTLRRSVRRLSRSSLLLPSLIAAFVLALAFGVPPAQAAAAEEGGLSVTVTRHLSVMGQAVGLVIEGPAELLTAAVPVDPAALMTPAAAEGATPAQPGPTEGSAAATAETTATPQIVVRLYGPLTLEQVGTPELRLPAPTLLSPAMKAGPTGRAATAPGDAVVMAVVPPGALTKPGAYFATVAYFAGRMEIDEVRLAEGGAWFGRMLGERDPLDLACVWPLVQGVHRDPDGVFFDDRLERALETSTTGTAKAADAAAAAATSTDTASAGVSAPAAGGDPGRLWDLLDLAKAFPDWRFTLAVEPILLTQLGEMSDGYSRANPADSGGAIQEVGAEDGPAVAAADFIAGLKQVTASGQVDVAAGPYASPSPPVLAAQDWGDGVGQMRVGKQVVQQVLPLSAPVMGAHAPDLDLSTGGLSSFSDASMDHLLVDAAVAEDLAQPPAEGAVTVRARDPESERLTLVVVDSSLRALLAEPWDPGLFCAGLAARVTTPAEALVLAPSASTSVPPLAFLTSLGDAFAMVSWLRTVTLDDFIAAHPPGSRPVLLDRPLGPVSSYVTISLLESITSAREAVNGLAAAAGLSAPSVRDALLLLYTAESWWWSLPGTSPRTASVGLDYALRAQALAQGELQKMRVAGVDGTRIVGGTGTVVLRLGNEAGYPVRAQVNLEGTGIVFPEGSALAVGLQPGETEVTVAVSAETGEHSLKVELLAGRQVVDTWSGGVDFVTATSFLPWIITGVAVIVLAAALVLLFRHRRRSVQALPNGAPASGSETAGAQAGEPGDSSSRS